MLPAAFLADTLGCLAAPETFDKFVNGGKDALVEFYAPWWGSTSPDCLVACQRYDIKTGLLIAKDMT